MAILSFHFQNFRNLKDFSLKPCAGITVITGNNGLGKTTILEGINLLGSGRSFRTGKNKELIRFGEDSAQIEAKILQNGLDQEIKIQIQEKGKKVFINGKLAKSNAALFNIEPSITFSPADHKIVEGEAADRRSFINKALTTLDWEYLETFQQFTKVLNQRNSLLKQALQTEKSLSNTQELLEPWDEQFVSLATDVMWIRRQFINSLNDSSQQEYKNVAKTADLLTVSYLPGLNESIDLHNVTIKEELKVKFAATFSEYLRRDYFSGSTRLGPQRDEILLTLNGNEVKFYSSQGEKRTCALALRLGELALFRARFQKTPVLLFDDVSSELDSSRRRALVDLLRNEDTQVFITATELPSSLIQETEKKFDHIELQAFGESL